MGSSFLDVDSLRWLNIKVKKLFSKNQNERRRDHTFGLIFGLNGLYRPYAQPGTRGTEIWRPNLSFGELPKLLSCSACSQIWRWIQASIRRRLPASTSAFIWWWIWLPKTYALRLQHRLRQTYLWRLPHSYPRTRG